MTSPTNRTDEVARQVANSFQSNAVFGGEVEESHLEAMTRLIASAITSAVAEERERAAKLAGTSPCGCGECLTCAWHTDLATAIRQTPTQEWV